MNTAFDLLSQGCAMRSATAMLAEGFGLSQRQASRYILQAGSIKQPAPITAPSVAMTVKVPQDIAMKLRTHAHATGSTIGNVVSRAVLGLLAREPQRG